MVYSSIIHVGIIIYHIIYETLLYYKYILTYVVHVLVALLLTFIADNISNLLNIMVKVWTIMLPYNYIDSNSY